MNLRRSIAAATLGIGLALLAPGLASAHSRWHSENCDGANLAGQDYQPAYTNTASVNVDGGPAEFSTTFASSFNSGIVPIPQDGNTHTVRYVVSTSENPGYGPWNLDLTVTVGPCGEQQPTTTTEATTSTTTQPAQTTTTVETFPATTTTVATSTTSPTTTVPSSSSTVPSTTTAPSATTTTGNPTTTSVSPTSVPPSVPSTTQPPPSSTNPPPTQPSCAEPNQCLPATGLGSTVLIVFLAFVAVCVGVGIVIGSRRR